jgi:hypothetical protein
MDDADYDATGGLPSAMRNAREEARAQAERVELAKIAAQTADERKLALSAHQKAVRDARYAARKHRKRHRVRSKRTPGLCNLSGGSKRLFGRRTRSKIETYSDCTPNRLLLRTVNRTRIVGIGPELPSVEQAFQSEKTARVYLAAAYGLLAC